MAGMEIFFLWHERVDGLLSPHLRIIRLFIGMPDGHYWYL